MTTIRRSQRTLGSPLRTISLALVTTLLVSQMVTVRATVAATATSAASAPTLAATTDGNVAATNRFVEELAVADEFFSQGQYKKARTAYQALISLAANKPEGYMGLGRVDLLEGHTTTALSHLEKAVQLAPQSADAHFVLGSSLLSTGNPNRAFTELTIAEELDPQRPEIQYKLTQARSLRDAKRAGAPGLQDSADAEFVDIDVDSEIGLIYRLLTGGRITEAIEQGTSALADHPDNSSLNYQIGLMYKISGHVDNAIRAFEKAVSLNPNHSRSIAQLYSLYLSKQDIVHARECAEKWIKVDPDDPNAHFAQAWSAIICGAFHAAVPGLEMAVQLDPRNVEFLNHYGLTLRELGNDRKAAQIFERALSLQPSAHAPCLNLAMICLANDEVAEARDLIEPLRSEKPVAPDVQSVASLVDARVGNMDSALDAANNVLKRVPDHAVASVAAAEAMIARGQREAALDLLATTFNSHPDNLFLLEELAEQYLKSGEIDTAVVFAFRAREVAPDSFLAHKSLVAAYSASGDLMKALEALGQLKKKFPDDERVAVLEMDVLERNDSKVAEGHYREILRRDPSSASAAISLAALQIRLKKYNEAAQVMTALLERQPTNPEALLLLAKTAWLGKKYQACIEHCSLISPQSDQFLEGQRLAARCHYKLKHWAETVRLFKSVSASVNLNVDELVALAQSFHQVGSQSEAIAALERAKSTERQALLDGEDLSGEGGTKMLNAEIRNLERVLQ